MPTLEEWVSCTSATGNALLLRKCNSYRARVGLPPLDKSRGVGTVVEMALPALLVGDGPSVGVGDSVAKALQWSRLKEPAVRFIKWWWQTTDCGCAARQAKWNERWPWPEWWRSSIGTWWKRWI